MRILYLGIATNEHLRRWVLAAVARGHEVHVASFDPSEIPGVHLHALRRDPFKARRYAGALVQLRRLLPELAPDLLHAHYLTGYGYLAPWLGHHPWALTIWGSDVYKNPHRSLADRWLSRRALAAADLVIGDSRDVVHAAEQLGARPARSAVIPWGVETNLFRPLARAEQRAAALGRLELPSTARIVLSARSLAEPFYRVRDVVHGALEAMATCSDLYLLVAGGGALAEPLRRAASGHAGAERIRWLGPVPRSAMPELMGLADLYVSVPTHDATSVALLEAMAAGCAVVASDLPSNREWVRTGPGPTGRLVPPESPRAIAKALIELLEDELGREQLGRRAREVVLRHGEFERCQDRVDGLIRALR